MHANREAAWLPTSAHTESYNHYASTNPLTRVPLSLARFLSLLSLSFSLSLCARAWCCLHVIQIRDLLAGARGSRITLGFTSNYGNAYEVDLVRNVRSTKKPGSAYGSQRAARPASWQVQGDNMAPPPLYEGFQVCKCLKSQAHECTWRSKKCARPRAHSGCCWGGLRVCPLLLECRSGRAGRWRGAPSSMPIHLRLPLPSETWGRKSCRRQPTQKECQRGPCAALKKASDEAAVRRMHAAW